MEVNFLTDEDLSKCGSQDGMCKWDKLCILGQSVHDHHDGIVSTGSVKSLNKFHTQILPDTVTNSQWQP